MNRVARTLEVEDVDCPLCLSNRWDTFWQGPDTQTGFHHRAITGLRADEFRFVRCSQCRHVYLNPRPRPDQLSLIYEGNYYAHAAFQRSLLTRLYLRRNRSFFRSVFRALRPPAQGPTRVIDIGCGNGLKIEALLSGLPSTTESHVVDSSSPTIEELTRRGHVGHVGGYDLPSIPRDSFDVVFASHVIEHTLDPRDMIRHMASYARTGGLVVIDTPNRDSVDARLFRRGVWHGFSPPQHLHLFNARGLEDLLSREGLDLVARTFLPSGAAWVLSIHDTLVANGWGTAAGWIGGQHIKRLGAGAIDLALLGAFTLVDGATRRLAGESTDMRIVARRR